MSGNEGTNDDPNDKQDKRNTSNSNSNKKNKNDSSTEEVGKHDLLFQEAPLFSSATCCSSTFSRNLRNLRWSCARPFQAIMFPYVFGGISSAQILFFLLFLAWILQSSHFAFIKPSIDSTGELASYATYLTFLTANKSNSIFAIFLGIPYDRLVYLHRTASLAAVLLGFFHTYVVLTWNGDESDPILNQIFQDKTNITGTIVFLSMLCLVGSSLFRTVLRKYCYQIWFSFHTILALTVAVALILHEGSTLLIVIVAWTVLDVLFRFTLGRHKLKMTISSVELDPQNPIVVLRCPNTIPHAAGQFLRVKIPSVSVFESHTFSISSAPHDGELTMHISCLGDWGSKLLTLARNQQDNDDGVDVYVDGPYGSLSLNASKYDSFLFVSGGIGVTPCLSIARQLIWQARNNVRIIRFFNFVWIVRDPSLVTALSKEMDTLPAEAVSFVDVGDEEVDQTQQEFSRHSLRDNSSIFITRQPPDDDVEAVSKELSFQLGRPNLDRILKETAELLKVGNVAVIACGSPSLMKDLETACRKRSASAQPCSGSGKGGVFFDLHMESFEF